MGGSIKEKDLPSHISVIALSSIKGSMTEIPHDHGRPMLSRVFDVYKDSGEWKACSRLKKKKIPVLSTYVKLTWLFTSYYQKNMLYHKNTCEKYM